MSFLREQFYILKKFQLKYFGIYITYIYIYIYHCELFGSKNRSTSSYARLRRIAYYRKEIAWSMPLRIVCLPRKGSENSSDGKHLDNGPSFFRAPRIPPSAGVWLGARISYSSSSHVFKACGRYREALERKELCVQWKWGCAARPNSGIVGRTWFLETLLPSGRKHRAPGYERAPGRFSRTIRFRPRKLPEEDSRAPKRTASFSCPRGRARCLPSSLPRPSLRLNRSDSTNLVDEWIRSEKPWGVAVNHAA